MSRVPRLPIDVHMTFLQGHVLFLLPEASICCQLWGPNQGVWGTEVPQRPPMGANFLLKVWQSSSNCELETKRWAYSWCLKKYWVGPVNGRAPLQILGEAHPHDRRLCLFPSSVFFKACNAVFFEIWSLYLYAVVFPNKNSFGITAAGFTCLSCRPTVSVNALKC